MTTTEEQFAALLEKTLGIEAGRFHCLEQALFDHEFAKAVFGDAVIKDHYHRTPYGGSRSEQILVYKWRLYDLSQLPTTEERIKYYLDHQSVP
jgi:hypothetical protein